MEPDVKAAIAGLRDWLAVSDDLGEAAPRLTSTARADLLVVLDYAAQTEDLRDVLAEMISRHSTGEQSVTSLADQVLAISKTV